MSMNATILWAPSFLSLGDDRYRFPVEDDVPGGPDGAAAVVGHGGAGALPLAHPLLHQRLHRRRRRLRHHKLKLLSSGEKEGERWFNVINLISI